ncbi:Type II/IV secretion system protein [uncultured archaeon]|nr:Type II/IV secretion system protein [uncultured archaeon]
MFRNDSPLYSYDIVTESGENVMYINYLGESSVPSIADSPEVMARTIDALSENANISRVVLVQQRNYSYDFSQVQMLVEIAALYTFLNKQERVLSQEKLSFVEDISVAYNNLNYIINTLLKYDPIQAYKTLNASLVEQQVLNSSGQNNQRYIWYLQKVLTYFENLSIIKKYQEWVEKGYSDSREIYGKIFRADIMPNFTFTRMVARIPEDAEIVSQYEIATGDDKSTVTIFREPNKAKLTYHLSPPEYLLKEEHHMLLNLARNVLIEHRPTTEEFNDLERTRQVFFNVARDLIQDLSSSKNISLSYADLSKLATILVRYTIGFGIIEVLLQDDNLQDIALNAPVALAPIFVRHNEFEECTTNIIVSYEDVESWAAKFRMLSGRALDEANPILDTNLNLNEIGARVAIIQQPLSIGGLAYSIRRRRTKPWTLPLFIKNKMVDPLGAGLLSFLIDGARTMLVAGTRSSGKTSILGSLMLEIMPRYRVITVEDTPELPVDEMRKLDYNILSMKVRSALTGETSEVSAEEGIRSSLRLGDSSLIVGEIRSAEAKALYEAMRIGALANVVAGTIHGASPYAIFDRVVNDLQVPVTSFKATDCIVVANPIKSPDGLKSVRRLLQISEVRKHWNKDPLDEGGFVDLMKYEVKEDKLKPSDDLINGDSEIIKDIASNVKGWAGNWDAVWDNIVLRQKIKQETVDFVEKTKNYDLLEAPFTVKSNNAFHQISEKIREEVGLPVSERVFPEWKKWLEKNSKRVGI